MIFGAHGVSKVSFDIPDGGVKVAKSEVVQIRGENTKDRPHGSMTLKYEHLQWFGESVIILRMAKKVFTE